MIATSEHNQRMSGALKDALDWAWLSLDDSPLSGMRVVTMGASQGSSGTKGAQMHLRQMWVYINLPTLNRPQVLLAHGQQRFD